MKPKNGKEDVTWKKKAERQAQAKIDAEAKVAGDKAVQYADTSGVNWQQQNTLKERARQEAEQKHKKRAMKKANKSSDEKAGADAFAAMFGDSNKKKK